MKIKIISTLLLIVLFVGGVSIYIAKDIDKYSKLVDEIPLEQSLNGSTETNKIKSFVMQKRIVSAKDTLTIYGSSELYDDFIDNIYKDGRDGFFIAKYGRGFYKDLNFAIDFAAVSKELAGKKVVVSLSSEWFNTLGYEQHQYYNNFSELLYYTAMFSKTTSNEMKKRTSYRILQLGKLDFAKIYALLSYSDNYLSKAVLKIAEPIFKLRYNYLYAKDLKETYKLLKDKKASSESKPIDTGIDWTLEKQAAHDECKQKSTNELFMDDISYRKYSKEFLIGANELTEKLPEYEDLQILLDICKANNIKPLFLIAPFNARYAEKYKIGQSKNDRQIYYAKVKKMIENSGFDIADLSEYEYEPYFMRDNLHLSKKGWVYAAEKISQYYKK